MAFSVCRAKSVAVWPENSVQSCPIRVPSHWAGGPVLLPCQGGKANSQPCLLLSIVPSPNWLLSLIRQPMQPQSSSYSLAWAGNQASSPIQLFLATAPLSQNFGSGPVQKETEASAAQELNEQTHPETQLSWLVNCLCQSKSVKGNCLLKCADSNLSKQESWKIR